MARISKLEELETPQGEQAYKQGQTSLKNSELQQFNAGAESFKPQKQNVSTSADAYNKLITLTKDPSPKNYQSAILQLVKIDMPDQAAGMSTLEEMRHNPAIMGQYGDQINQALSGVPLKESIEDLQRTATGLMTEKMHQFRSSQKDEMNNAKVRGADSSYVNSAMADDVEKRLAPFQKKFAVKKYSAPTPFSVAPQIVPPDSALGKGAQGVMSAAQSIGLLPSDQQPSARAVPVLSAPDRAKLEAALKADPKGPRADRIKRVLGGG
jgi:hypothetical protein